MANNNSQKKIAELTKTIGELRDELSDNIALSVEMAARNASLMNICIRRRKMLRNAVCSARIAYNAAVAAVAISVAVCAFCIYISFGA